MTRQLSRRPMTLTLNVVGLVLVALSLAQLLSPATSPLTTVTAWTAWALWAATTIVPEERPRVRVGLSLAMVATGSFVAGATNVVGFVPATVGLLIVAGQPAVPRRLVAAAVTGSATVLAAVALVEPVTRETLVTTGSLLVIGTLVGLSRRQHRSAEAQSLALLEERLAVEQERALVAALTERSRIARDLHDVLAHSLGGLVIQLETVDALLESGRADEARERVVAARGLAVSGLDEAKQAVSALREPAPAVAPVFADLIATHRALGARVEVRGGVEEGDLAPDGRIALRRAVQELLTNARRHAPGEPTTLGLDRDETALTLTASTPAPAAGAPRGGDGSGLGLTGMRERVVQAGGRMTVRTGPPFEVVVELPRPGSRR